MTIKKRPLKGISALIATVLLAAFVIAVGSLVLAWLSGTTDTITKDVDSGRDALSDCTYKAVSISDVFIDTTKNTSRAIVTNDGNGDIELKSLRIYNTAGESCDLNITAITLETGEVRTFLNSSGCVIFDSSCTDFNYATVTTSCGSVSDTYRAAPTCS